MPPNNPKRFSFPDPRSLAIAWLFAAALSAGCSHEAASRPDAAVPPTADGNTPASRSPAKAIVAGGRHACALLEGGDVACWGSNSSGQLGDGTHKTRDRPVRFGLSGATELLAGFAATCARVGDAPLSCTGRLMLGTEGAGPRPQQVELLKGVRLLGLGRLHGCGVGAKGGQVACWGSNHFGQFGDGTASGCGGELSRPRNQPGPVPGVAAAEQLSIGDTGSCALLAGGSLKCWGVMGLATEGEQRPRCAPVEVTGLDQVKQVVLGAHHGCALQQDGRVMCWGANAIGQLGTMESGTTPTGHGGGGTMTQRHPPTQVAGLDDAVEIAAFGTAHSCARRRSGQVVCWGRNVDGQLGDGTTVSRHAPVPVLGIDDAIGIATGYDFSCALRRGGEVMCWGKNEAGQLGNGSRQSSPRPVATLL